MLAATMCLQDPATRVDIMTSSDVLAARDAKDWTPFYEKLSAPHSQMRVKVPCAPRSGFSSQNQEPRTKHQAPRPCQ